MINKLDYWHKTRFGLFTLAIVELAVAYGFASLSIARGNLWYYLFTLIFLVGALKNLIRLVGKLVYVWARDK
jgi:hypothetical protein